MKIGSDPGPFFLGRHGIYFHEQGVWIIWLVFRGNHVHSGTAPRIPPGASLVDEVPDAVQHCWNQTGEENRSMTVSYLPLAASTRNGTHAITRATQFGNEGVLKPHKIMQRTFAEHGHVVLGSTRNRLNKLGSELIYSLYNGMQDIGLKFSGSLDELARMWEYEDEDGGAHYLDAPPIDIVNDSITVARYRRYYTWHWEQSILHYTRVTKDNIASAQAANHFRQTDTSSYAPTECHPFLQPLIRKSAAPAAEPSIPIIAVKERHIRGNKVSK